MAFGGWSPELPLSDYTGLSDLLAECPVRGDNCLIEGIDHPIREICLPIGGGNQEFAGAVGENAWGDNN